MHKTTLLLGTALLLGGSYQAQAQYRGRGGNTSLGIKAGASLASFVGADTRNTAGTSAYDYRFGFHAGVFANVGLSKLFAFQPELMYSQKGTSFSGSNDVHIRMHYLDVPLAFHVNTDGFFLEAGPQVGFLVAATNQVGSLATAINSYNTVDFGYLAGIGYQKKHGPGIGLRYNGGFTNFMQATSLGNATLQTRARNSAFQLYLTYSFN